MLRRSTSHSRPHPPIVGGARATSRGSRRSAARAIALAVLVWGVGAACAESDVGRCCKVLAGREGEVMVPMPTMDDNGQWQNTAATNPAFDCEELTCVSYEGSATYCTRECEFDASCPEGFTCAQVIKSSSGPGQGPKSYCVKVGIMCTE